MRFFFILLCLLALAGPAGAFRVTGDLPAGTVIDIRAAESTMEFTPRALSGTGTVAVYAVRDLAEFTPAAVRAAGNLMATITPDDNYTVFTFAPTERNIVTLADTDGSFGGGGSIDVSTFGYVSGGDASVFDVTHYGAVAGDDLDDAPAINAAIVAACALSVTERPTVRIPAGVYKAGATTGFYSGVAVPCDVTIVGDGRTKTIIEPMVPTGSTIMHVCGGYDTHGDVDLCTQLDDVRIADIGFRDDDPYAHGHAMTIATVGTCGSCSTPPTHGDAVTWTGGAGNVHDYDVATGFLAIDVTSGTLEADDVITDGNYSLSTLSAIAAPTSEESHGLTVSDAVVYAERLGFYDIADEGLDAKDGSIVYASDVYGEGCSQAGSGGSTLTAGWGSELHVDKALIYPGQRTVDGGAGAGIAVESSKPGGTDADSPIFTGTNITIIEDPDADLIDQIEMLVSVSSPQHNMTSAIISGSTLDAGLGNENTDAVVTSGGSYVVDLHIANSVITGRLYNTDTNDDRFSVTDSIITCDNDNITCVSNLHIMSGNTIISKGTEDPAISWSNDASIFTNNVVFAEQTCMYVTSGSGVAVTDNVFNCGLNTVGADYAIRFLGTSNDVYVAGNYFEFIESANGVKVIRSGLPDSVVNQNASDAVTTGTIDATTNRGDLTP